MSDPILCRECGHDIDHHSQSLCCTKCWHDGVGADDACWANPSDIARAYGEERFHEGWDACELRWAVRHSE